VAIAICLAQTTLPAILLQTAYVLSYSVIMLNTDQHNPTIKKRMSMEDFVKNNRGIDDGRDLNRAFLEELYNRIKTQQIMMRHTMMENQEDSEESNTSPFDADHFIQNIFALFGRTTALRAEPTEEQIAQLSTFLKVYSLSSLGLEFLAGSCQASIGQGAVA
jgi:Sec7-like guanine-nucleotide exchange factor